MAKWRVYNMHPDGLTHTEKFRDEVVSIKAGEYALMDYEDAVQFKGQFYPIRTDAMGARTRDSFKVIKLIPDSANAQEINDMMPKRFICNMDGKQFPTQEALDQYTKENYSHLIFKDDALEQEITKTKLRK